MELTQRKLPYVHLLRTYGTVFAGLLIIAVFSILSPNAFATIDNAINISRQIVFLVLIALGATLVMAVGEFDLSVGAIASLGGVFAAKLAVAGLPIFVVILIPLACAFVIGYINGWIVTKFRVLSFITTLGMGTIIGGISFKVTNGATIFQNIPKEFLYLGQTKWGSIPLLSIIMIMITILFWYIMSHSAFGRKLYAIGGNESASRVAGVKVAFNKNLAFALCSALATLAGILMATRLGSAHPTGADGLFLNAYAAVFLGMTCFKEGVPNIWGTFVGAAIIGILSNGMTILAVPTFMQNVITGLIVIIAVLVQKMGKGSA